MLDATFLGRLYARYRLRQLAASDPVHVQRELLLTLIAKGQRTLFGKEHGFSALRSVEAFQAAVPLRPYEAFWKEYWRERYPELTNCSWPGTAAFFALSSGTTSGATKYIPLSREMLRANYLAAFDLLTFHLQHRPASRILGGKNLLLGGSTDLTEVSSGIWSGDLSGIVARDVPWWLRTRYFPPPHVARISEWERKVDEIAVGSLGEDIRLIGGVPSWLLMFFNRLAEVANLHPFELGRVFPNLELIAHGGVRFDPYAPHFQQLLSSTHAELREVYPASEGFIAVADRGPNEGLRLLLDRGIFFEFVPVGELDSAQPTRHWIATAEKGVDYALVLSTASGLWSYLIGDVVQFVTLSPPRVLVRGRTSYFLSAFGEHLSGAELEAAVLRGALNANRALVEFTVSARVPRRPEDVAHHLYVVELRGDLPLPYEKERFLHALDEELTRHNDDYRAHRSCGLACPDVLFVREGAFAAWMKRRGKLGGQHKVPRVIHDEGIWLELMRFINETGVHR